jgi:hypothetical protein
MSFFGLKVNTTEYPEAPLGASKEAGLELNAEK